VLFVVCGGTGLLVYVLMWILVPKDDGVIAMGDNAFRAS
jgi:phage shock protein PspC (stress-responsive transcriptional regulator)